MKKPISRAIFESSYCSPPYSIWYCPPRYSWYTFGQEFALRIEICKKLAQNMLNAYQRSLECIWTRLFNAGPWSPQRWLCLLDGCHWPRRFRWLNMQSKSLELPDRSIHSTAINASKNYFPMLVKHPMSAFDPEAAILTWPDGRQCFSYHKKQSQASRNWIVHVESCIWASK